jgi:hypothetical protein
MDSINFLTVTGKHHNPKQKNQHVNLFFLTRQDSSPQLQLLSSSHSSPFHIQLAPRMDLALAIFLRSPSLFTAFLYYIVYTEWFFEAVFEVR